MNFCKLGPSASDDTEELQLDAPEPGTSVNDLQQ